MVWESDVHATGLWFELWVSEIRFGKQMPPISISSEKITIFLPKKIRPDYDTHVPDRDNWFFLGYWHTVEVAIFTFAGKNALGVVWFILHELQIACYDQCPGRHLVMARPRVDTVNLSCSINGDVTLIFSKWHCVAVLLFSLLWCLTTVCGLIKSKPVHLRYSIHD